jgi:hypothetical protein
MTIMTVRILEDVKAAFGKAFEGEDKDAIVARLLLEAAEKRGATEEKRPEASLREVIDVVLELRKKPPYVSDAEIKAARLTSHGPAPVAPATHKACTI